jgi:hypothetical protein
MATVLQEGDRVIYKVNGRKMRAIVGNHIPFLPQIEVPIRKRNKEYWVDRKLLRKLPNRKAASND